MSLSVIFEIQIKFNCILKMNDQTLKNFIHSNHENFIDMFALKFTLAMFQFVTI